MPAECVFVPALGAEVAGRGIDATIAALAEAQHGVVSRRQLLALGLGRRAIGHRVETGRLRPLYRGVYAVGHRAVSQDGRWMAALLASGPDAVLSHRSAAAMWGISVAAARIEVTVPGRRDARADTRLHTARLAPDEVQTVRRLDVTTPARTLIDLAAVVRADTLARAVREAEVRRLADATSLAELIERHRGRRGLAAVRRIVAAERLDVIARSELEERFLAFAEEVGLPAPRANILIEGFEVDFAWREERLIVELDGFAYHGTRAAFERDRARDRRLQAAGWRVVRITWRQLRDERRAVAAELAALLRRAAS